MFKKILVANRGEIALRVMRACHEMGIRSVAVYSDADRRSLHVAYAAEAFRIGPAPSTESYLRPDAMLDAARKSGADAIHPGYGFLSENPEFARACAAAGVVFIGPPPGAMDLMGSKTAARECVRAAGIPMVPGTDRTIESFEEIRRTAAALGYPVMLKAAAGGGGKGMRLVASEVELESAVRTARSEAANAFSDPSVYLEKYLERPRHIEVQILGDAHGKLVHLGERECSLQRRHQKLVEESPSPSIDRTVRARMCEAATTIGRAAGYANAGTVEFLVDQERKFYFLEMNARLQVEHPVTELVTGIDLVKEQIRIASGEPLGFSQEEIKPRGHALECRIYAEDPGHNFFPSPGQIQRLRAPSGPGVRDDSGVYEGWTVPVDYDPLLSKLVTWGRDRTESVARMRRALDEYDIAGIETNLSFFRVLMALPEFASGAFDTGFIDRMLPHGLGAGESPSGQTILVAALAAALEAARRKPVTSAPERERTESAWKTAGRRRLQEQRP